MLFRIGQGYDIHPITEDRALFLGGYEIKEAQCGLLGHSDADVLLHAIIDALLGALALRDIGQHFPDTDEKWAGIDSKLLLKEVLKLEEVKNWQLQNLDSTIITEKPKLAKHIPNIRKKLAELFNCETSKISVKAKTNEKFDAVGNSQAMAAQVVLLLKKKGKVV